mmetsp:Transcript_8210/g.18730  ORF Transcript_8210/g.18730 Transcript_8210/m.18730 type:complete len:200 (-) Transcript_8210:933-1532(-)
MYMSSRSSTEEACTRQPRMPSSMSSSNLVVALAPVPPTFSLSLRYSSTTSGGVRMGGPNSMTHRPRNLSPSKYCIPTGTTGTVSLCCRSASSTIMATPGLRVRSSPGLNQLRSEEPPSGKIPRHLPQAKKLKTLEKTAAWSTRPSTSNSTATSPSSPLSRLASAPASAWLASTGCAAAASVASSVASLRASLRASLVSG